MKTVKNVYISGLGAIGAAYGSIFHKAGKSSVNIIVDKERLLRYSTNGICVNGQSYEFNYVTPDMAESTADLILIAVKGHHLSASMADIRPFVGEHTIIMSLLNGITSEDYLEKAFGRDKILHSFCVGTDAVREGTRIRYTNPGRIVFGDKYCGNSDKIQAVKAYFDAAGMPYEISDDIMRDIWWKFMLNVGINQNSAILRAPYGVFQIHKEASDLIYSASAEVIPLAQKEGINLTEDDVNDYVDVINALSPDGKTSMLQDVEACRKTEVESFALTVIELGKKHNIPTPVNKVLYRMIKTIERTYPS